ncbi:DUF7114 family protein [Halorarius halobius]|uniref:DUF7114 family protein n=1 Tax=Halorarius halobius TaxID=2962671 RepID=UPI0020CC8B6E|nr:hypothetical protein [Halorarius halobius]
MDEAAAVRRAALGAVGDVTPAGLRDDIEGVLDGAALFPGAVTLATATAAGVDPDEPGLADRAAGVQLIYDGLRLTRRLAHENPWSGDRAARDAADMDILAADVLVARGFRLLAPTEAAADAVEVVRAFGRDQTDRWTAADPADLDRELEADVLRLAVTAGATAAGGHPSEATEVVAELAATWDGAFPDPAEALDCGVRERLAAVSGSAGRPLNRND